jgi:fucose permease
LAVLFTFRDSIKLRPKPASIGEQQAATANRNKTATRNVIETLKLPPVYRLSMFYFFMLGTGVTAGGWVVEYLVSARQGKLPDVGYVPAGLWGGVFLGRVLLAEPTHRFGERRMIMGYCGLILALQLVFWLVPNLVGGAIAISFLGFFYGPLFATVCHLETSFTVTMIVLTSSQGMSIGAKLFDQHIQSTALGFVFVFSEAGGALFPAVTGIVASQAGAKVMQPILVGLIVAMAVAWALVPKVPKRRE